MELIEEEIEIYNSKMRLLKDIKTDQVEYIQPSALFHLRKRYKHISFSEKNRYF